MSGPVKSVAVVTSGYMPVPDVKGGAVESLVQLLVESLDSAENNVRFIVYSCDDEKARLAARQFKNTDFIFIQTPSLVSVFDRLLYRVMGLLGKDKAASFRYCLQRFWYLNRIAADLGSTDYDALVLENHASLFLILKRKRVFEQYKGKTYFHLHNDINGTYGCTGLIRRVKKVIGISDYICASCRRRIGGMAADQFTTVKNVIDLSLFRTEEAIAFGESLKARLDIKHDDQIIIYCGRIAPEKGVKELLSAFKLVHRRMPKTKLLIVGSTFFGTDATSAFEAEIQKLSETIRDAVRFTGYVSHDLIPGVLSVADVCCAPSTWNEPACLAAMEAIAAGKPLVTTRKGGIPEYIGSASAIILDVDSHFVENLASSLIRVLEDGSLRAEMEKNALKARHSFDSKDYLRKFLSAIDLSSEECV